MSAYSKWERDEQKILYYDNVAYFTYIERVEWMMSGCRGVYEIKNSTFDMRNPLFFGYTFYVEVWMPLDCLLLLLLMVNNIM